jgi:hypothetical protein
MIGKVIQIEDNTSTNSKWDECTVEEYVLPQVPEDDRPITDSNKSRRNKAMLKQAIQDQNKAKGLFIVRYLDNKLEYLKLNPDQSAESADGKDKFKWRMPITTNTTSTADNAVATYTCTASNVTTPSITGVSNTINNTNTTTNTTNKHTCGRCKYALCETCVDDFMQRPMTSPEQWLQLLKVHKCAKCSQLRNGGIGTSIECVFVDIDNIVWSMVRDILKAQEGAPLKLHTGITNSSINLNCFSKMNNNLAHQVMNSHTPIVLKLLYDENLIKSNTRSVEWFVQHCSKLEELTKMLVHLEDLNDPRLTELYAIVDSFQKEWKDFDSLLVDEDRKKRDDLHNIQTGLYEAGLGVKPAPKQRLRKSFLTDETWEDLQLYVGGIIALANLHLKRVDGEQYDLPVGYLPDNELFSKFRLNIKFLIPYLSQDIVENYFSETRQGAGMDKNPTVASVKQRTHSSLVKRHVRGFNPTRYPHNGNTMSTDKKRKMNNYSTVRS